MATILAFRPNQRASAIARAVELTAEIVFFPGVRYERWADEPREAKPVKRTRRRDQLELAD